MAAIESPIKVVVTPAQSSCFAGESLSVTITFTNTRSPHPGASSSRSSTQPYGNHHKRSAHSISAVPLAKPPTSPRTPRSAMPLLPVRSVSEGDSISGGRKGLVGRGRIGHGMSIQTGADGRKGRNMPRSLSLDISPKELEQPPPTEIKTPLHVQRALNISAPSSPRVSSPLARSATLPLPSKHPHARKMSVMDAQFPPSSSQEFPSPVTSSTMSSSASTSTYSLSLDPISESSQASSPSTPFRTSPIPTGTVPSMIVEAPTPPRANGTRAMNLNIGQGRPLSAASILMQPPKTAGVYTSFPQSNTEVILYSYVQFIGSLAITPISGSTNPEQDRALGVLRSTLLKRSIIGGGSMDITASLDPNKRRPALGRHNRSSSFSAGVLSLLTSPSSLLGSSPKVPASPSWSPGHRSMASVQASQSAPTLGIIGSTPRVANSGYGLGFSSSVPDASVDPETPLPTYEVQPTMLGVDLALAPGESRSYTYTLSLPQNLPPTFRGRTFRFSYELVVGVCRAGNTGPNSNSRVMKVPMRVYNNVTVGRPASPYDLFWPVVYARTPGSVPKPSVVEEIPLPKSKFSLTPAVSTKPGSVDTIREYAKRLLASVPDSDPSRSLDVDAGREREAGGLTGCREAVEILSRNPKKMSYDVNKDGIKVAVLTFTKAAYRLGETVLCVVDLNERQGQSKVLKLSAMLETQESLPTTIAVQSNSRLLRRSHAEYHSSLVSSTLRTTFSLDIPPDASPAFQIDVNGEPGYLEQRPPPSIAGGLEWKVRLCLLVAVASESTREGIDGVRLKSLVRDGPRGEWGSSWRGAPTIAPMQYPMQPTDPASIGTPTGLRSWATYLASPFIGASPETYHGGDEAEGYDGDDPIAEDDEGWTQVRVETVECEVPIKVWPGNTAFKAADVVFEV